MRGCNRARTWLLMAADGELSVDRRLELDRHLVKCEACRAESDAIDAIESAMVGMSEPPVGSVDLDRAVGDVRARILCASFDTGSEAGEDPLFDASHPIEPRVSPFARRPLAVAAAALVFAIGWAVTREDGSVERDIDELVEGPSEVQLPTHSIDTPRPLEDPKSPHGMDAPAEQRAVVDAGAAPVLPDAGDEDAVDPARLEATRGIVTDALLASFAGVPLLGSSEEAHEAVLAFEEATAALAGDWPLVRIAHGLVKHKDEAVAGAAVRYLGSRGDVLSTAALRDALDRPELGAVAVLALAELGEVGLSGLADALDEPELFVLARDHVVAVGGARAADVLATATRNRRRDLDERVSLTLALAAVEPCPVDEVFALIDDGFVPAHEAYRALAAAPASTDALLAMTRLASAEAETLLGAFAVVRPEEALPWIADQATRRQTRKAALACLAAYENPAALGVLADLYASGRARADLVIGSATTLLEADAEIGVQLARRPDLESGSAKALLDLLLSVEDPSAAPTLCALAFHSALPEEDRPWAALAAGELGDRDIVLSLVTGVATLGEGQETLAAAALLAGAAVGDRESVLNALAARVGLDASRSNAILALCDEAVDRGARAVTLLKVARLMRPLFDETFDRRAL